MLKDLTIINFVCEAMMNIEQIHLSPMETHLILWPLVFVAGTILTAIVLIIIHRIKQCQQWFKAVDKAVLDEN